MDMRFYWLKDRETQKQIIIHWKKGTSNIGDYPTKHHPTKHHQAVRPIYVLNAMTRPAAKYFLVSKFAWLHTQQRTTLSKGVLNSNAPNPYGTRVIRS